MDTTPKPLYPNLHGTGTATLLNKESQPPAYGPSKPIWKQRLVEASGRVVKITGLLVLLLVTSLNADRHPTCVYYTKEIIPGPQPGRNLCDGPALAKLLPKFWIDRAMWGVFASIEEARPDKDHCMTVLADATNPEHMFQYRELLAEGFTLTLPNAVAEEMARRRGSTVLSLPMAHEAMRDYKKQLRDDLRHRNRAEGQGSARDDVRIERNRLRVARGKPTRPPKTDISSGIEPYASDSLSDSGPFPMNICYHGGYVSLVFGSELTMEWIGVFMIGLLLFGSVFLNYTMFRVAYALAVCAVAFIVGYNPAMIVVFLAWGTGELLQHFVGRRMGMKPPQQSTALMF